MMKFPVAEIFGPTIQGEGLDQGVSCHFVRFGGCDFRCEWCDTPHAVLPEAVKHLPRMSPEQILDSVQALPAGPRWVVLSGGNPAILHLEGVVSLLQGAGYLVSVETQGTRYIPWLNDVDRICLSPKPPSSGMKFDPVQFGALIKTLALNAYVQEKPGKLFVKIVVFNQEDYDFAKQVFAMINSWWENGHPPYFVSAGNDAGKTVGNPLREDTRTSSQVALDLISSTQRLTNWVMVDTFMGDNEVKVQAQSHVLLWGNERGR